MKWVGIYTCSEHYHQIFMPRHSFSFPEEVRNAVLNHVNLQVGKLNPQRYNQEPLYYSALIHGLEGVVYDGRYGRVEFEATAFDDRGRGSAESLSGADFAITATISSVSLTVRKAILFQAKKGYVEDMSASENTKLRQQLTQMKKLTRSPKVLEMTDRNTNRRLTVISGNILIEGKRFKRINLSDYIVRRVLTTLDGDTRPQFVDMVQDSKLPTLKIKAALKHDKSPAQQLRLNF